MSAVATAKAGAADAGDRRSRRRTQRVDYTHLDAPGSDEEDEVDNKESIAVAGPKKRNTGRKQCPGCGEYCASSTRVCPSCDYQFGKGGATAISAEADSGVREKFTFDPERGDDGSYQIERICGMRPLEREDMEDEDPQESQVKRSPAATWLPGRARNRGENAPEEKKEEKALNRYDYEYFIKYRGVSYLHLKWLSAYEIEMIGTRARTSLNRFLKKVQQPGGEELADPTVDTGFTIVERILDVRDVDKMIEVDIDEVGEGNLMAIEDEGAGEEAKAAAPQTPVTKASPAKAKSSVRTRGSAKASGQFDSPASSSAVKSSLAESLDANSATPTVQVDPSATGEAGSDAPSPAKKYIKCEPRKLVTASTGKWTLDEEALLLEGVNTFRGKDSTDADPEGNAKGEKRRFWRNVEAFCGHLRTWEAFRRHYFDMLEKWRKMGNEGPLEPLAPPGDVEIMIHDGPEPEILEDTADSAENIPPRNRFERWQMEKRCMHLLDRLMNDSYAEGFNEPVDTSLYDDYLGVVETPMDLGTVRKKLEADTYRRDLRSFRRDLKLVWHNCKIYNVHGSGIWQAADYLDKLSARLLKAWVLDFEDGAIPYEENVARPWEESCRVCLKGDHEESLLVCSHCDGYFHTHCLNIEQPGEDEEWFCPRCAELAKKVKAEGKRFLTHKLEEIARNAVEQKARKRTVAVRQRQYLVKWQGLSYRDCTWETKEDINDDGAIRHYHEINDTPPEEPPLTKAELLEELSKRHHIVLPAQQKPSETPELEAQIHSQLRAFHFLKERAAPPMDLIAECGPQNAAATRVLSQIDAVVSDVTASRAHQQGHGSGKSPAKAEEHTKAAAPGDLADAGRGEKVEKEAEKAVGALAEAKSDPAESKGFGNDASELKADISNVLDKQDSMWGVAARILNRPADSYLTPENALPTPTLGAKIAVAECVESLVHHCARGTSFMAHPGLPPPGPGEYDTIVPKTVHGLLMNIGDIDGHVVVMAFRRPPDNLPGPAEREGLIKKDDVMVAINGIPIENLPFGTVIHILSKCTHTYVYLRMLRSGFLRTPAMQMRKTDEATALERLKRLGGCYFPADNGGTATGGSKDDADAEAANDPTKKEDEAESPVDADEPLKQEGASAKDESMDVEENTVDASGSPAEDDAKDDASESGAGDQAKANVKPDEEGADGSSAGLLEEVGSPLNGATAEAETAEGQTAEAETAEAQTAEAETAEDETAEDETEVNGLSLEYLLANSDDEETEDESGLDGRARQNHSDSEDDDDAFGKRDDGEWRPKEDREEARSGPMWRLHRAIMQATFAPLKEEWTNFKDEMVQMCIAQQAAGDGRSRSVQQLDDNHRVIATFPSISAASRQTGVTTNQIHAVLQGRKKKAGGFIWKNSFFSALDDQTVRDHRIREDKEEALMRAAPDEKERANRQPWRKKLYKQSREYRDGRKLRDYQVEGLNWMLRCYYGNRGCILADEMGLGKTVQVVSLLEHIFRVEGVKGPFLVVVPLSTIEHWRREFEGWTDMRVCVYHDTGSSAGGGGSSREMRDVIREYEWYWKNRSRRLLKFQILLTTYEDLIKDFEHLMPIPWHTVVIDEAHRLRNQVSKLLQCLKDILPRGMATYGYQHRVLMTGTPLQNNTQELWTLLNFIEQEKFPELEDFQEKYGNMATKSQVLALQRQLEPHLLRRVKEDVAADIPPKEETIIDVELTTLQKQFYRAIFEKNHAFLYKGAKSGAIPKLLNVHIQLRKVCNHPFLISGVEDMRLDELEESLSSKLAGENGERGFSQEEFHTKFDAARVEEGIIAASGKMVLVDKLLPKLQREGHKVLIFSQMVRMLDLLQDFCGHRGFSCERLDGAITGNDRQKAIDRFNTREDSFVFLLSTRAGGVGINLTAADTVIIYDSDWNPQNDVQAMARCHRIGQTKDVRVYRLITRRSFEAEMFDRASRKLGLEQAILGTGEFGAEKDPEAQASATDPSKMSAQEMENLLRKGAYHLLDDDEEEVQQFCEGDIDSILKTRTRVHVVEGGSGQRSAIDRITKTRRAGFGFDGEEKDGESNLDLHDPDFWKKIMPDMITPHMLAERLEALGKKMDEDDSTFEADAERYMDDLTRMTASLCDQQDEGKLHEDEKHAALTLLLRVSMREELFSGQQRMTARNWAEALEGDRRRGRARRPALKPSPDLDRVDFGSDSEAEEDERDDEFSSKPKSRKRKREPRAKPERLTTAEAIDQSGEQVAKRIKELRAAFNKGRREQNREEQRLERQRQREEKERRRRQALAAPRVMGYLPGETKEQRAKRLKRIREARRRERNKIQREREAQGLPRLPDAELHKVLGFEDSEWDPIIRIRVADMKIISSRPKLPKHLQPEKKRRRKAETATAFGSSLTHAAAVAFMQRVGNGGRPAIVKLRIRGVREKDLASVAGVLRDSWAQEVRFPPDSIMVTPAATPPQVVQDVHEQEYVVFMPMTTKIGELVQDSSPLLAAFYQYAIERGIDMDPTIEVRVENAIAAPMSPSIEATPPMPVQDSPSQMSDQAVGDPTSMVNRMREEGPEGALEAGGAFSSPGPFAAEAEPGSGDSGAAKRSEDQEEDELEDGQIDEDHTASESADSPLLAMMKPKKLKKDKIRPKKPKRSAVTL